MRSEGKVGFWDARAKRRAAIAFDLLDHCLPRVLEATSPIFREDPSGRLESVGSAVLLALGKERIVLTAAHVLDDATKTTALHVGSLNSLVRLRGMWFRTPLPKSGQREEDRIDVGAVRLPMAAHAELGDSCFLTSDDLAPFRRLGHGNYALLSGYPSTKQGLGEQLEREANLYTIMAECCTTKDYTKVGVGAAHAFVLAFDKKRVWRREGRATAPKLIGMSGGGLWVLRRSSGTHAVTPRLCGIIIELHSGMAKRVVATRIEVLLSGIWGHWPELRVFLPEDGDGGESAQSHPES